MTERPSSARKIGAGDRSELVVLLRDGTSGDGVSKPSAKAKQIADIGAAITRRLIAPETARVQV